MAKPQLAGQNSKISAANHEFLVNISRYLSSKFVIFARNFGILPRHYIVDRFLNKLYHFAISAASTRF
jgi:hypothetical protein